MPGGPEEAEPHTQVRPLPQSRRGVLPEGTQALLPLEGLSVRQLPAGGGEAAGDGGAGGPEETASHGGETGAATAAATQKFFYLNRSTIWTSSVISSIFADAEMLFCKYKISVIILRTQ